LLTQAGIDHVLEASGVDETRFDAATPEALVCALADAKARAVAARSKDALVLGCEQCARHRWARARKPPTARAALEHWSLIAGRTATLSTGHTLLRVEHGSIVARAAGGGAHRRQLWPTDAVGDRGLRRHRRAIGERGCLYARGAERALRGEHSPAAPAM